jgi:hypothetical protein
MPSEREYEVPLKVLSLAAVVRKDHLCMCTHAHTRVKAEQRGELGDDNHNTRGRWGMER